MSASPVQPATSARDERTTETIPALELEFELLLACCGNSSATQGRIHDLLQRLLDWRQVVAIAAHHGVVPQLCEKISSFAGLIPHEAYRSIRKAYESNAKRTLWLSRELASILRHLEACNIPAIPYKGPALAEFLYGDVIRREFSDLDILIRPQDVIRARSALREIGFTAGLDLTPSEEQAFLRSGYEFTLDSVNGRNLLEIQWQILPRFYAVDFDMEGFFARAVIQTVAGLEIPSLCPEDLLLTLCAHAAKHLWVQLSWFCDVVSLAESTQIGWDSVWRQAEALGIERIVAVTFTIAHRLLGAPLPPAMRTDSRVESLVSEVIPLIMESKPLDNESMAYFRLIARSRERRMDRVRFWWRLATTPSVGEWSAVRLPAPLFPLYRVVRAVRLGKRLFQ
jgi:hypothetical protein